jgi:tetratricopeptide (TPR) repeat protein
VRATATNWLPLANGLKRAVADRLRQQCGFESLVEADAKNVDVLVDLDITAAGRGGTGMIHNPNLATLDTLLVLSDGQSGELLGTARIHGESSGLLTPGANPENEAVVIVAKSAVDLLATSGCAGPRIARADSGLMAPTGSQPTANPTSTTPTTTPVTTTTADLNVPAVDESHRADAEALNDQGKEKLRSADLDGALVAFKQAVALLPDPRYQYNACLALEAQQQWDAAAAACRQARGMSPKPELATKIDARLDLLAHHQ